ncbi:MAG: aminotransferase class IV [Saprospiraceae bacterium]
MLNLNGTVLSNLPADLERASRGLFYSDALFETMRVFGVRLPFLERHLERLFAGMDALGYAQPAAWSPDFFRIEILKISPPNARVRLTIWRTAGGRFLPENNAPHFLIAAEPLAEPTFSWPETGLKLGIAQTVVLPCDAFSNFKTLNAARYVAAAREARAGGFDDVLIPNQHGRICETTIANVFMFDKKRLVTPALSEGCVAGTMRAAVLELAVKTGLAVAEQPVTFAALARAEEIFLTNAVRGIVPVGEFQGRKLPSTRARDLFEKLTI